MKKRGEEKREREREENVFTYYSYHDNMLSIWFQTRSKTDALTDHPNHHSVTSRAESRHLLVSVRDIT